MNANPKDTKPPEAAPSKDAAPVAEAPSAPAATPPPQANTKPKSRPPLHEPHVIEPDDAALVAEATTATPLSQATGSTRPTNLQPLRAPEVTELENVPSAAGPPVNAVAAPSLRTSTNVTRLESASSPVVVPDDAAASPLANTSASPNAPEVSLVVAPQEMGPGIRTPTTALAAVTPPATTKATRKKRVVSRTALSQSAPSTLGPPPAALDATVASATNIASSKQPQSLHVAAPQDVAPFVAPPAVTSVPSASPATSVGAADPGDDTQRNFRYQHAFGVILLLAAATGQQRYKAAYCEHHEDLLFERNDERFDAYQIKTRKPEEGAWQLNHKDFEKSIRRFVDLDILFPKKIADFFFVSNAMCLETNPKDRPHHSPIKLLELVTSTKRSSELKGRDAAAFGDLRDACNCNDSYLWGVLKRLHLVQSPSREDIDDTVAHSHLPQLPECKSLPAAQLNGLRDELIDLVFRASARAREDASRHFLPLGPDRDQVRIRAKRVLVDEFLQRIRDSLSPMMPPFRYTLEPERLKGGAAQQKMPVMEKKLVRAGLHSQVDLLRRRALDAEQYLLERILDPMSGINEPLLDHVTSVVSDDCSEALLEAQLQSGVPVGAWMLNNVYRRLKERAVAERISVAGLPYEVLVGLAALLTADCKVWWGDRFDVSEEVA